MLAKTMVVGFQGFRNFIRPFTVCIQTRLAATSDAFSNVIQFG
jgi:hypothetical protein